MDIDITAWEHNVYKCNACNDYWSVSFPIKENQTIIHEEALYCRTCRCIGRLILSKQEPVRAGRVECSLKK